MQDKAEGERIRRLEGERKSFGFWILGFEL